jgi:hypothetical protein
MREVLFPRLIRLRADDDLVHDLAEAARRDKLSLSEFAGRELRKAVARTPVSVGRTDACRGPQPCKRFSHPLIGASASPSH